MNPPRPQMPLAGSGGPAHLLAWQVAAAVVLAAAAALILAACDGLVGCGRFCDEEFWGTAEATDVQHELDRGADILAEHQNGNPRAPLAWAAQYGDSDVMVALLKHSEAREDGRVLRSGLMSEAVRYSQPETLALFFEREVHLHAAEDYLLLHNALSSSNRPAVELLLEHGADISRKCPYDWTPLHMAARSAEPALIEFLLDQGADADLRPRR